LNYLIYFLGERKAENPERKREPVEMEMECAEKFSYLMQPGPIPTWLKVVCRPVFVGQFCLRFWLWA